VGLTATSFSAEFMGKKTAKISYPGSGFDRHFMQKVVGLTVTSSFFRIYGKEK